MDEPGFPVLVADMARRMDVISGVAVARFWPMVRSAAAYLVCCGPVSEQDRWEEDPGYSPFTLAVEIAALLAAADYADSMGEKAAAAYLRETADAWNASVERWTYVEGTELAERLGVRGYYVRVAPPETADATSPVHGFVPIKNRPPGSSSEPAAQIISPDALALVRFGLRAPDDSRILDTARVIDALLKVETPFGPSWHRYNDDGYGEHEDGAPFDGTGVGRAWPLLTGERAHYEIAAGNLPEAERLLKAFGAFANEGGMLPEQVWDSPDVSSRELFFGRPSGSAMPLAWAHAEYVKLVRSLRDGTVFDMPPQTVERYLKKRVGSRLCVWRLGHRCRSIPLGKTLRLQLPDAALVHWTADGWSTVRDDHTDETDLGPHVLDLPTESLKPGGAVTFTFRWERDGAWEGRDFAVAIES
jgi:glucoamylase